VQKGKLCFLVNMFLYVRFVFLTVILLKIQVVDAILTCLMSSSHPEDDGRHFDPL
jgi:hypothetical protein